MECTFKRVKHLKLRGPNITTNKTQTDKTTTGMKLELLSIGTLRISSHPLQIKDILVGTISKEGIQELEYRYNFLYFNNTLIYLNNTSI